MASALDPPAGRPGPPRRRTAPVDYLLASCRRRRRTRRPPRCPSAFPPGPLPSDHRRRGPWGAAGRSGLVHRLGQLVAGLGQLVGRRADLSARCRLPSPSWSPRAPPRRSCVVLAHLVAMLLQGLLGVVDHRRPGCAPRSPPCLRSSAACDSASLAIFSTSSLLRPEEEVMVIFCSLLVADPWRSR
jgi:hypothetical protein